MSLDDQSLLDYFGFGVMGDVQKFIDTEVIRFCEPFVPMESGLLAASAYTSTVIGSGEVVYNTPYAHYQYYGVVYGPNIPIRDPDDPTRIIGWRSPPKKYPTERSLKYSHEMHENAGPFWDKNMMAVKGSELVQEVQDYVRRKH